MTAAEPNSADLITEPGTADEYGSRTTRYQF